MSNVATMKTSSAVAVSDGELMTVLRDILYPGSADESVNLVLSYCKAAGLDPMQKPVHIVPMWNNAKGKLVDQVMPGIGLYRIQASRTGQYAGVSEPEFGPDVTEEIGGKTMTYPEWCKVTVKRAIAAGQVCEFTAMERWKENYATKKNNVTTPNAMWERRPYAQLAKCAEAQALRKAFPEVGSQPTADEMEGKELIGARDVTPSQSEQKPEQEHEGLPPMSADHFDANWPKYEAGIASGRKTAQDVIDTLSSKYTLSAEQITALKGAEPIEGEVL